MRSLFKAVAVWLCVAATSAAAQPSDGSSSEPIRLGLILDMSSVYSDVTGSGSETAARMAVEDFGGKLLGRPIEVLVADHQNKADIAAAVASKWFDVERVSTLAPLLLDSLRLGRPVELSTGLFTDDERHEARVHNGRAYAIIRAPNYSRVTGGRKISNDGRLEVVRRR